MEMVPSFHRDWIDGSLFHSLELGLSETTIHVSEVNIFYFSCALRRADPLIPMSRSLKRIISPNLFKTVPFSDVILADILTSSAKVLGDVWLAACYIVTPIGVKEENGKSSCGRIWGVPLMVA